MTFESYVYLHNMCTIAEQLILVTLFCEAFVILWDDENAKISAFLCETALCGAVVMTDVMSAMGPVMTGLTYTMIISFVIKLLVIAANLSAARRHQVLVNRCKRACKQNMSADDICLICQAYCRQVRQICP